MKQAALSFWLFAVVAGSACTPTRISPPPAVSPPNQWSAQNLAEPVTGQDSNLALWWQGFNDPLLNELIAAALSGNPDLKIAVARIKEANAAVIMAESMLYPSLDFGANGGREKRIDRIIAEPGENGVKLITPTADAVSTGLNFKWELDLFGANQLTAEVYLAQAEGSVEGRRALQSSLVAQLAANYFELRAVQRQLDILRQSITVKQQRLQVLEAFYQRGLATALDISGQQALLQSSKSTVPKLENAQANLIHRLGVLLGREPAYLQTRLTAAFAKNTALPAIPALLPASLLESRPDIRRAKTAVTMAAASLGVANANLLPKFNLAASGGFGALAVGGFPSLAESVFALGSGITAPIFNAGRIRAQITAADARLEQVAIEYEKSLLTALEEVENAFVAYKSAVTGYERLTRSEDAAERNFKQSQAFYRRGGVRKLAVLDSELNQLTVAEELSKSQAAEQLAIVALYRAFGGGWSELTESK